MTFYTNSVIILSMKPNLPDKSRRYVLNNGTYNFWEIWQHEDFSDGSVLLYETETGEDFIVKIKEFDEYFTAI